MLSEHNSRNRWKYLVSKKILYKINNFTTVIQMCYILSPLSQSIKANAQVEILFKGRIKCQELEKNIGLMEEKEWY